MVIFRDAARVFKPMHWQLKLEYLKCFTLCFIPVGAWGAYQEIELHKIRTDDSYLDAILKSSDTLMKQGDTRNQFVQTFINKKNDDSRLKSGLEKEAYAAIDK